jgi:high-affinity iron transporter
MTRLPSLVRSPHAPLVALLAAGALLAGCGGDDAKTHAGEAVAPASTAPAHPITKVYGTDASPAEVAAAAIQRPTAAGLRSEINPLPESAFDRPIARYLSYATGQARAMRQPVAALIAALQHGDRDAAETAWGEAYDRYLLLGAAYGALGDLDVAIDGTPGHLAGGVTDPDFTGLHRIEHDLWSGVPLPAIVPFARRLSADVDKIPHALTKIEITPLDYATRAHEIMEDAQRDMISDRAAPWSGAGVRATADGLAATETVIDTLRPVLNGRGEALPPVDTYMLRFRRVLDDVRRAHGGRWPRLPALSYEEHIRVNGTLGALLEALSSVPETLETTLPPAVPSIASQETH